MALVGVRSAVLSHSVASCSGRPQPLVAARPVQQSKKMRGFLRLRLSAVQAQASGVSIEVDNTSWNSRRIYASVPISAPVDVVWSALTDYENLSTFIPSLVENRCLEKKNGTAVLYQVGAQDVAMGVKFKAACTLSCQEFLSGVPEAMLSTRPDDMKSCFPVPTTSKPAPARDITFTLVEGDFQEFRGVWRMQPHDGNGDSAASLLSYALYVKPQAWLPVGIIQSRIEREVVRNLQAVCRYAETCWSAAQQQQQPTGQGQLNTAVSP